MADRGGRFKAFAKRGAALVLSLLVGFALVELLLRILDYTPAVSSPLSGFHRTDPDLGWRGVPGYSGRFKTRLFDIPVETDGEGFRKGAEAEVEEGAPDLWVLGDSTVWGWGVAAGELFTDHLQKAAGPGLRVRNYGINAYGTLQERLLLEQLLESRSAPAKLLLMVCANDFDDNLTSKNGTAPHLVATEAGWEIANQPVASRIGGISSVLARRSRACAFLSYCTAVAKELRRQRGKATEAARAGAAGELSPELPEGFSGDRAEAMALLLGQIAELCEGRSVPVEIAVYPLLGDPGIRSAASVTVERICDGLPGVRFVEIESGLAEGREDLFFGSGDFHWNAEGNRRGAEAYLSRTGFIVPTRPLDRDP